MSTLDDTYGAILIGVVAAAVLYGFTCVQTWYYFTHYTSDPWYIKLLVAGVLFSDTCHQALITHAIYIYLVTNFGVVDQLGKIVWSMIVEVFFNGFTTLFVQCFLTLRVHKLSNRNWLATGPVLLLVFAEFFAVLVFGAKAVRFETWLQLTTLKKLSMTVNALAAAGDILIAMLLCSMLRTSRTGFRKSNTIINKLVMFSINTGLLTSMCALASLICISAWPHTFIYVSFYFCIGRLYCNSLLATLNARKGLRGMSRSDEMSLSLQGQGVQQMPNHSKVGTTSSKHVPNNISIKIDTTHEYIQDEQYSAASGDVKNSEVI